MKIIVLALLSLLIVSCQQPQGKRLFTKNLNAIKKELFLNDTTWHDSRYESNLTRCVSIYYTDEMKMNGVVNEFNKYYTLVYYGDRDNVCNAYDHPEQCSYNQLVNLPRPFLGYATDYSKVAVFTDYTSLILVGYHEDDGTIVIYEPYSK